MRLTYIYYKCGHNTYIHKVASYLAGLMACDRLVINLTKYQ